MRLGKKERGKDVDGAKWEREDPHLPPPRSASAPSSSDRPAVIDGLPSEQTYTRWERHVF